MDLACYHASSLSFDLLGPGIAAWKNMGAIFFFFFFFLFALLEGDYCCSFGSCIIGEDSRRNRAIFPVAGRVRGAKRL